MLEWFRNNWAFYYAGGVCEILATLPAARIWGVSWSTALGISLAIGICLSHLCLFLFDSYLDRAVAKQHQIMDKSNWPGLGVLLKRKEYWEFMLDTQRSESIPRLGKVLCESEYGNESQLVETVQQFTAEFASIRKPVNAALRAHYQSISATHTPPELGTSEFDVWLQHDQISGAYGVELHFCWPHEPGTIDVVVLEDWQVADTYTAA